MLQIAHINKKKINDQQEILQLAAMFKREFMEEERRFAQKLKMKLERPQKKGNV